MAEQDKYQNSGYDQIDLHQGEVPDNHTQKVIQAIIKGFEKFPELAKKHRVFIQEMAVLSVSGWIIMQTAINLRLEKDGVNLDNVVDHLTQDDIDAAEAIREEKRSSRIKRAISGITGTFSH